MQYTRKGGRGTLIAVALGTFLGGFDTTSVNATLPLIQSSFHTSIAVVEWVVVAYLLTLCATQLTFQHVSGDHADQLAADRFRRHRNRSGAIQHTKQQRRNGQRTRTKPWNCLGDRRNNEKYRNGSRGSGCRRLAFFQYHERHCDAESQWHSGNCFTTRSICLCDADHLHCYRMLCHSRPGAVAC
jgi:hypothetical protein